MKVLVIEDDVNSAELLDLRLQLLGCSVVLASDAARGLTAAREERPDLILLDLKLEGGLRGDSQSGAEVFAELRNAPETADIPVVLHSIYVMGEVDVPVPLGPRDGYLRKPFRFDELRQLVERHKAG